MKNKVFELILAFFNQEDPKIAGLNNVVDTNNNDEIFDDNSYIDDVLNSKESIQLAITNAACKLLR